MRIHPRHRAFDHATNAALVRGYLEHPLRRRLGGPPLEDVQVTRLFPRPHDGFVIQYQLRLEGGDRLILCGYLLGPSEGVPEYVERQKERVVRIDALGLIVPVFPFDPELKALEEMFTPGGSAWLAAELGWCDGPETTDVRREVLGYRLAKRCVVRYSKPSNDNVSASSYEAIVKAVGRRRLKPNARAHAILGERGFGANATDGITVARTLLVDERRSVHVMEVAPGTSLHDLMDDAALEEAYWHAGLTAKKLHAVSPQGFERYSYRDETDQLTSWVSQIAQIFPDYSERFDRCRQLVCDNDAIEKLPNDDATCIHRDLYDKQVLFSPDRTTLLDCDNAAEGDPAQDYGNFAAHVVLRKLQHPRRARQLDAGMEAFTTAYPKPNAAFARRAKWWEGATLLRLSSLYALRPKWRSLTDALLEQVELCTRQDTTSL